MKIKNKGKVFPSPSSSSSSSTVGDVLSVLNLLPAAILAAASILCLSLEDREVLAYMITRSMKTTTSTNPSSPIQDSTKKSSKKPPTTSTNPSSLVQDSKKKSSKKPPTASTNHANHKGTPIFRCDCFDCYTSYWFRWDSSPNRELIHQVIEAFEDHLANGEKSSNNTGAKRRDKTVRRVGGKSTLHAPGQPEMPVLDIHPSTSSASCAQSDEATAFAVVSPDDDVSPAVKPAKAADGGATQEEEEGVGNSYEKAPEVEVEVEVEAAAEDTAVVRTHVAVSNHKGLARKVLPDVIGLLNSRLWSLWSPNV